MSQNQPVMPLAIKPEVRDRILQAADRLYEQGGRVKFPRVSDVRNAAQCDMGLVSPVLAEWKRAQTAKPEPVAVSVPEHLREAGEKALQVVWLAAKELGDASLRAAEADWRDERAESEIMRSELSEAYDAQVLALEKAERDCSDALNDLHDAQQRERELENKLELLRIELAKTVARAEQGEARIADIENRVADLKSELSLSHEETKSVRNELTEARNLHIVIVEQNKAVAAEALEKSRQELSIYKGKAEESITSRDSVIEKLEKSLTLSNEKYTEISGQLTQLKADVKAEEKIIQAKKQDVAKEALRAGERYTALQTERDNAVRHATELENHASKLSGKLETLEAQNAALLGRLSGPTK
jgi:colicin import membrane protein